VRPIRFDHIAIALPGLADAVPVLVGALGGLPDAGAVSPSRGFRWGCWRFAGGGRVEILEPLGADSFLRRYLAERGPSIHHVTFKVPGLIEACERAEACGFKIVGYDDSDPSWKEAFLHPKQALGIVVQLGEPARGGEDPRRSPPPALPDPPPPVTILGLRMRARSRERAMTLWERVLQGACAEDAGGELVFRWPSPMRIAVDIDPAADEGPVAIEFTSEREVTLPGSSHPLDALFMRVDSESLPPRGSRRRRSSS